MLRFGEIKKEKKLCWDVNIVSIVISKLIETKTNSKYLIEYLDKVIKTIIFNIECIC